MPIQPNCLALCLAVLLGGAYGPLLAMSAPVGVAEQATQVEPSADQILLAQEVARYRADPVAYCAEVVPSRVALVAPVAEGVAFLSAVSPRGVTVDPGDSVVLTVQAVADAPVTFTSGGYGAFENGHATITVRSTPSGVASATFTATAAVTGMVDLAVGCPLTAGQISFVIEVRSPHMAGQLP